MKKYVERVSEESVTKKLLGMKIQKNQFVLDHIQFHQGAGSTECE